MVGIDLLMAIFESELVRGDLSESLVMFARNEFLREGEVERNLTQIYERTLTSRHNLMSVRKHRVTSVKWQCL
jgi:hypothetical protein